MRRHLLFASCLLAGLGTLAAQQSKSARLYELVVLDAPFSASAAGVNARGHATGVASSVGSSSAFLWTRSGGQVPLAPAPGFPWSTGTSVNRDGFVLGTSFSASQTCATLWSPAGTPLRIPDLGWSISIPGAIDRAGVVVGNALTPGGWSAWIWDAVNGTRELTALGLPPHVTVTGLNDAGLISGAPGFGEAFLFDLLSASTTSLGTLGGDTSAALAVNASGHAVGWSWTALSNDPTPFFWSPATGMISLGTFAGPGFSKGRAFAVNRHDAAVGSVEVQPGHSHAFLWDASLGLRDLNSLVRARQGVELEEALSLSDTGWIAGKASDHANGGRSVGFLLRPR